MDGFDGFELGQGGGHLAEVPQRLEPLRVARDRLDPGGHPPLQHPPGRVIAAREQEVDGAHAVGRGVALVLAENALHVRVERGGGA